MSRQRASESIDAADELIIDLLAANGRTTNRQLANAVGLTEATVASRIRRLTDEAHVVGIGAVLDWEAAGFTWDIWIFVRVAGRAAHDVAVELSKCAEVHSVSVLSAGFDLVIHGLFPDRESVAAFLTERLPITPGVETVSSNVTVSWIKYRYHLGVVPLPNADLPLPAPSVALDDIDRAVLRAIVADGRQSNRRIARSLRVSEGTIRARLQRLEESGLIRITAQTDPYRTGTVRSFSYFGINTTGVSVHQVAEYVAAIPDVTLVAITAGAYDIVAHAVARGRDRLTSLVTEELRRPGNGVRNVEPLGIVRTVAHNYRLVRIIDIDLDPLKPRRSLDSVPNISN